MGEGHKQVAVQFLTTSIQDHSLTNLPFTTFHDDQGSARLPPLNICLLMLLTDMEHEEE